MTPLGPRGRRESTSLLPVYTPRRGTGVRVRRGCPNTPDLRHYLYPFCEVVTSCHPFPGSLGGRYDSTPRGLSPRSLFPLTTAPSLVAQYESSNSLPSSLGVFNLGVVGFYLTSPISYVNSFRGPVKLSPPIVLSLLLFLYRYTSNATTFKMFS